ncbi:MAG TPA: ankyrin repeat domain-containing protein [Rickettsia endosymbiont of Pyrocoelia pectoralis]|nr:ankyrin repeat domain-containing protein [Rickettsia endosymbiont of Pyrocoelia pectoralis]
MSKTPIKLIMIIADDLLIPNDLRKVLKADEVLCIGDGKMNITLDLIREKLQGVTLAENLRVDINVHGNSDEEKQHYINITNYKTESFLKDLKEILLQRTGKQELVAEWHLWSCYGGSSNKVAHILGKNNTLITYVNSKNAAISTLYDYTTIKSITNYLKNPQKDIYTRWVEEQKYNFQTSTFNFNPASNKEDTIHLKSARTLKSKTLNDIIKKFNHTNDLTVVFTDFIAENIKEIENNIAFKKVKELGYFKSNFKESDEVKIEFSNNEAKNLALGIAIYLSNNIEDQNHDKLKQYIDIIHKSGVDIDDIKTFDISLLFSAASVNKIDIVEFLKEYSVDVNKVNNDKFSPLYVAAQEGHVSVVEKLIENKAEVNLVNIKGETPLYIAAQESHDSVVEKLINNGADPNIRVNGGNTPLICAILSEEPNEKIIKLLITNPNINLDIKNDDAQSALHIATKHNHINTVKLLLDAGCNINTVNDVGDNALHLALQYHHMDIAKLLCSNSEVDIHVQNDLSLTPLRLATAIVANDQVLENLMHSKAIMTGHQLDISNHKVWSNLEVGTDDFNNSTHDQNLAVQGQDNIIYDII